MVNSNKNTSINSLEEENARLNKENHDLRQMVVAQERMLSNTTTYLDQQRKQLAFDKGLIEDENVKLNKNLEKRNEELLEINAQLEEEILQRKKSEKQLAEVNEELNDFMYRTAHDLRTPATNLKGLLQILEVSPEKEQILELLPRLNLTIDQLLYILKELTAVLDIRNHRASQNNLNLNRFFDGLYSQLEIPEKEAVQYINNIEPEQEIMADPFLLKQIVEPIISNAIIYSKQESSPEVRTQLISKKHHWILRIEDNGIGIPKSSFTEVFKMFHRANNELDGPGLGLYLAQTAASRAGAVIDFKSAPGKTEFSVIIPKTNAHVA